jgi:hypothetical protein
MKQKFLAILALCLFTASLVNAQVVPTTYRGAFAPAPTPMWTENWTNWDPNATYYPASNVTIAANTVLTGSVTWTRNNTYKIQGLVYVDSLATLTIEPGTVIRGDETVANSSLVVQRGGKLIANGTPCNPIVFTSNKAAGARAKGDWGGIIMLGRSQNNTIGGNQAIEGITLPNPRVFHGPGLTAPVLADNSGSLKYVRIEFGGYVFASNNEINGLTMGSVGSGTTIDYVQTSFINDDAFEWFGGTVNCSHLVSYRNLDDDFDTDNGYSGTVQFGLSVRDPQISDVTSVSTSEGFESDNNAAGDNALPRTGASFYNITQIGAFRCGANSGPVVQPSAPAFRRGARIRRRSGLKIFNSILMNDYNGLLIDANTLATNAQVFQNNIIAMDTTIVFTGLYAPPTSPGTGINADAKARICEDAGTNNYFNIASLTNSRLNTPCDILVNAWDFVNPDYRPNLAGGTSGGSIAGTDLSTGWEVENPLFGAGASSDLALDIIENGVGNSNGTITINVPAMSGWDIKVPGATPGTFLTLSAIPQPGFNGTNNLAAYSNGDWLFSVTGTGAIVITSNTGVTISQAGFAQLGLVATRKAGTPSGTNQNLAANVSGGGDNNASNDGTTTAFGAN